MSSLLLLSGGIDSICMAYWLRPALCLTINYGQHAFIGEERAARAVTRALNLPHTVLNVPTDLGAGIMANAPKSFASPWDEFWPFRNQLLITYAAGLALARSLSEIVVGTVATDTRHIDGSHEFIKQFDTLLAMQEGNIRLRAPAVDMTSIQLVATSGITLEILGYAHSCHRYPYACGKCSGCEKHSRTMRQLGIDR